MPAYRITDKGKYSQIVAYTGSKIESRWAVGKQVCIDFQGPDFVVSSKDGVFLQIPIANIAEPQTQTNADLVEALAFMVGGGDSASNIYVSDGALTDNRTLFGDAYDLLFSGIGEFEVSSRVNRLTASENNVLTGRNVLDGARNETPITYINANYTADLNADFTLVAESDLTVSLPTANIGDVIQIASNGNNVAIAGLGGVLIDNESMYSLIRYSSVRLTYVSPNNYSVSSSNLGAAALANIPRAFGSARNSIDVTNIPAVNTWTDVATTLTDTDLVLFELIAPASFKYLADYPLGFRVNVTGDLYNTGLGLFNVFADLSVFVNGVPLATEQEMLTTTEPSAISLQAFALLNPNDIVTLRVRNTSGSTNFRIENLHISIVP